MAGKLILIVEDNERNRKLVRDVLQFTGYETIEAETGEEGIRLAQERHPDLILMDIRLPGIDGITAFRRIRADPTTQGIPVIAMTASIMTAGQRELLEIGFDGYHSKPLRVREFVAAVQQLLERD